MLSTWYRVLVRRELIPVPSTAVPTYSSTRSSTHSCTATASQETLEPRTRLAQSAAYRHADRGRCGRPARIARRWVRTSPLPVARGRPRRAREKSARQRAQIFTKQANRWAGAGRSMPTKRRAISDAMRETHGALDLRARFVSDQSRVARRRVACAVGRQLSRRIAPLPRARDSMRWSRILATTWTSARPGSRATPRASRRRCAPKPGPTCLLMELTAGQGTVLGSTFEEMAALLSMIPRRPAAASRRLPRHRARVGGRLRPHQRLRWRVAALRRHNRARATRLPAPQRLQGHAGLASRSPRAHWRRDDWP